MAVDPPAIRHYWFRKAYADMFAAIKDSNRRNIETAGEYWRQATAGTDGAERWFRLMFFGAAAGMAILFGTLIWLVLVPLHVLVVLLIAGGIAGCFLVMAAIEACYVAVKGWRTICRSCAEKVGLPEFRCRGCGVWHGQLRPSSYGILTHMCKCGEELPSRFLSTRHQLTARCPHCQEALDAENDSRSGTTVIPLIGPTSAGKTTMMIAAMEVLLNEIASDCYMNAKITDKKSLEFFTDQKEHILRHGATQKTTKRSPAFSALVTSPDEKVRQQFYFFDLPGEAYTSSDLASYRQFQHMSGGIIIVDPFSLSELKAKHRAELNQAGQLSRISEADTANCVDHFNIAMQKHFGLKQSDLDARPFAVVVNKIDILGLYKQLLPLPPAGMNRREKRQLISQRLREKLITWGGGKLVNTIESHFGNVMYFPAAPIHTRTTATGPTAVFECTGVKAPIRWILDEGSDPIVKGLT